MTPPRFSSHPTPMSNHPQASRIPSSPRLLHPSVLAAAAHHTARRLSPSLASTLLLYVPQPQRQRRMIRRRASSSSPSFSSSSLLPAVLSSALFLLFLPHNVDARGRGSKVSAGGDEPASFFSLNSKDGQQWSLTNVRVYICALSIYSLCVPVCV